MAKERLLTILIPIKDSDCETTVYNTLSDLISAVPPSASNINNIYKVKNAGYYRSWFNPSSGVSGAYEYHAVVDREFPYLGNPLNIYDFTYDATRMGTAPTISAQNVMWYAEKDGNGNDITLEGLWTQQCHVSFNGENLYLKQIPTSGKSNEDARYKYDLDFVAERVVLENVYIYDVVQPFVTEKPVSENSTFSFFGDINELAKRINASLIRSGLATLTRKYVNYPDVTPEKVVPYLTYEQWNSILVNPLPLIGVVFEDVAEMVNFRIKVYLPLDGNYNLYLSTYIYENTNGVYDLNGYQCKIGKDKYGEDTTSEEKLVTFEKNTIYEALQQFHDTFELQYYIVKEKDGNGDFTGNTFIMVADCEHDFADVDPETGDFVRDDEGIPTTENPFDYGVENELLSKEKANTTEKIVTRITGVGSAENIPWYYPNPTPDGWIRPLFHRSGEEVQGVIIDYPTDEGSSVADSILYEKFLRNRIGNTIKRGVVINSIYESGYETLSAPAIRVGLPLTITSTYKIDVVDIGFDVPRITLSFDYHPSLSGCTRLIATLTRNALNPVTVGTYDTNETYQEPTAFQTMFINHNGKDKQNLAGGNTYFLEIKYVIPYASIPHSSQSDYEGYHYESQTIEYSGQTGTYTDEENKLHYIQVVDENAYIGENFYQSEGLQPFAEWVTVQVWIPTHGYETGGYYIDKKMVAYAGYSTNGSSSGIVTPYGRNIYKHYVDLSTGLIYECNTSDAVDIHTGTHQSAFSENPFVSISEWVNSFVDMNLRVYANDGWYMGSKKIELSDYGISAPYYIEGGQTYNVMADIFDEIVFQRLKWVTAQQNLMPEVFIKTDGERRFYNAKNYWDADEASLIYGIADTAIGEVQVDAKVRNPIFKDKETDPDSEHYEFESEYEKEFTHEHIEDFEDVKPTIEEQRNMVAVTISEEIIDDWANQYQNYFTKNQDGSFSNATSTYDSTETYYMFLRIDVVEEFAYDETDNDEIWESSDGGSIEGEYKHPYFFAKLRPTGYNIFDLALQDDMVISMTTGHCGACNFRIGVDENTKKNPVQIWEYDVYAGDTFEDKGELVYGKGTLRRYNSHTRLYYNTNGTADGYINVNSGVEIIPDSGGFIGNTASSVNMYNRYEYSAEQVANGFVGSTKKDGKVKFEGDVVTSGRFIASQQDTSENYVWVALFKDVDTYGVIMPAARPNYDGNQLNVYIRPKSIADVHSEESTYIEDEDNADKFVLINICMPQAYLRRAERKLSHELVKYMYEHNWQKFNFSLKFSRIYIAQNPSTDNYLNENSVLYVFFNGNIYRQYAKHYTYKMSHSEALPEISVDMNEDLTVTKTLIEQWDEKMRNSGRGLSSSMRKSQKQLQSRIEKTSLQKNETNIIYGNTVIGETRTSLLDIGEGAGGSMDLITTGDIDIITSN